MGLPPCEHLAQVVPVIEAPRPPCEKILVKEVPHLTIIASTAFVWCKNGEKGEVIVERHVFENSTVEIRRPRVLEQVLKVRMQRIAVVGGRAVAFINLSAALHSPLEQQPLSGILGVYSLLCISLQHESRRRLGNDLHRHQDKSLGV